MLCQGLEDAKSIPILSHITGPMNHSKIPQIDGHTAAVLWSQLVIELYQETRKQESLEEAVSAFFLWQPSPSVVCMRSWLYTKAAASQPRKNPKKNCLYLPPLGMNLSCAFLSSSRRCNLHFPSTSESGPFCYITDITLNQGMSMWVSCYHIFAFSLKCPLL